ncbi:MAG: ABC-F family ATP-binding cassette domain-containing protein [Candidatus Bathyarchaeia archaeon]
MISFSHVTKFYGKKDILRDCSLSIVPSDRIGLVGPNGSGKTTFLRLIVGEESPDEGIISRQKGLKIGYLPQELISFSEKGVLDFVMEAEREVMDTKLQMDRISGVLERERSLSELSSMARMHGEAHDKFEILGGYSLEAKAKKILMGLGFRKRDLNMPVGSFSGGWIMRAAIARILLAEPDLILLDEPTNHLDLDSLIWLEEYLNGLKSALIVVSHDRMFLNRTVRRIMEIYKARMTLYFGNYDHFEMEKRKRIQIQWSAYKNQMDRIRQIEQFIERNRVRKDRAKQVQSRIKALERMERIEPPEEMEEIHFEFPEPPPSGKVMMSLRGVAKSFDDLLLYKDVSFDIYKGDRIAFIGPNGAGKSTLMKILAGEIEIDEGERKTGYGVRIAYFSQTQVDQLNLDGMVIDEVTGVSNSWNHGRIRNILGAFLFRGDDVFKRVEVLSGGEKSRLLLCKILLQEANLLLLDEPTNHLDINSCEVLKKALMAYSGSLCIITHDRDLINAVANKILVIRDGKVDLFPGNYSDYENIWRKRLQEWEKEELSSFSSEDQGTVKERDILKGRKSKDQKRLEAENRNRQYRERQQIISRMEEIEDEIDRIHRRLQEIHILMGEKETYRDPERIRVLKEELNCLNAKVNSLTVEWEEKADALERIKEVPFQSISSSSSSWRPK